MFSYFRDSQGGLSDLGGVHIPPMFIHPIHLDTPLYLESLNRVFILLFYKMFSYFRGSHGGLSDLDGVHMPPMFIDPIYLDTPICSANFDRLFILL